jgi:uncharacterized protein with beta-barrel porin domain
LDRTGSEIEMPLPTWRTTESSTRPPFQIAAGTTASSHFSTRVTDGGTPPLLKRRRQGFLQLTAIRPLAATAAVAGTLVIAKPDPAQAQSMWQGVSPDYSDNANWTSGAPVAAGDSAAFGNSGLATINVTAPVGPDSWTFNTNAQNYGFFGAAVTFSNGATLTNNANAGQSIGILNNMTGTTVTQAGATSTLNLAGTNAFTNTSVTAGTLVNSGSLTSTVTNSATFSNSGTLTGNVANNLGGTGSNSGTISNGLANNFSSFTNTGTVNNGLTNSGSYSQSAGATNGGFANTGGIFASGGAFDGVLLNNAAGTMDVTGVVTTNGAFTNATVTSRLNVSSTGNYTISGALTNMGTSAGGVGVASGGTLTAGSIANTGQIVSHGTLATTGGLSNNAGGTLGVRGNINGVVNNNADGSVNVLGTLVSNNSAFNNNDHAALNVAFDFTGISTLTNASAVGVSVSTATLGATTIVNNAGAMLHNGGVTNTAAGFFNAGTFLNSGTVNGGVTNTGTVNAHAGTFNNAIANNAGGNFIVGGAVTSNSTFTNATGATLRVNGGGAYTLSGLLSNAGTVNILAGGVLNANGGLTSTSSTLSNNGTINGNVTNSGGTIGGNGTIVGTTTFNGGTLAPGNSIGTLTFQGNLVLSAATTYMVEVDPNGADRTNVTGIATLGGATVSAVYANGSYVTRSYTILNAQGGVIGTFNALVNTNLPANFTSSLRYDPSNAYLDIALNFTPPPPAGPTAPTYVPLTLNQRNVADALVTSFNVAGGIPLALGGLNAQGLTQVSGEHATGTQQTTFDAMDKFVNVLTDPFMGTRAGGTPATGASGYTDEDEALAYAARRKRTGGERDAYAAFKSPPRAMTFDRRWSVWGAGYGGTQQTDGDAGTGSQKFTNHVYGGAAGFDYRLTPETLVGFALGGAGATFGLANGLGGGRSEMFQAGLYGRHTSGAAYISGALAWGWQDITLDRTVFANSYRANFDTNAVTGRLEGGWRFAYGTSGITPYAAGQVTSFFLPGYAEQLVAGVNTFALTYAEKDVTASRTELGLRGDTSFTAVDAVVTLRGRAAWAHNFNTDRSISALFQSIPAAGFTVFGASPAQNSALVSAGAEAKWLNGFSVAATFEGEQGRRSLSVVTSTGAAICWRRAWRIRDHVSDLSRFRCLAGRAGPSVALSRTARYFLKCSESENSLRSGRNHAGGPGQPTSFVAGVGRSSCGIRKADPSITAR